MEKRRRDLHQEVDEVFEELSLCDRKISEYQMRLSEVEKTYQEESRKYRTVIAFYNDRRAASKQKLYEIAECTTSDLEE